MSELTAPRTWSPHHERSVGQDRDGAADWQALRRTLAGAVFLPELHADGAVRRPLIVRYSSTFDRRQSFFASDADYVGATTAIASPPASHHVTLASVKLIEEDAP